MASSKNIVITLKGQIIYKNSTTKNQAQEKLADTTDIPTTSDMGEGSGGGEASPLGSLVGNIRSVTTATTVMASVAHMGQTLISNGDQWFTRSLQAQGRYREQQTLQEAKTIASWMTSSVGKIGTAAITGGPIGAVVATLDVALETSLSIWQNQENQRLRINQQETEMDMSRVRAGYSLTSGSYGEDR